MSVKLYAGMPVEGLKFRCKKRRITRVEANLGINAKLYPFRVFSVWGGIEKSDTYTEEGFFH